MTDPTELPITHLMMDDSLFPDVLAGALTNSVRLGYRPVILGPLLLKATRSGYLPLTVIVTKVTQGHLSEITDADAKRLGSTDALSLFAKLRRFYPKIVGSSAVTIIEFDRPQR